MALPYFFPEHKKEKREAYIVSGRIWTRSSGGTLGRQSRN